MIPDQSLIIYSNRPITVPLPLNKDKFIVSEMSKKVLVFHMIVLCHFDILRHQNKPSINRISTTDKGLMLMS